jgi:flagellar biosynthesis/type III secretory pathway chaperone
MLDDTPPPAHDPAFDDLLLNLDRQGALYDRLLELSERERAAIARADLAALAALVAEKERLVAEAQALERQRAAMCAGWARQHGLTQPPTLDDVRAWSRSPAYRARLDAAALTLSRRVSRLRRVNARNADVLTQAQRMNSDLLAAALRHARHPMYTPQGGAAPDQRPSLICDYRA